MSTRRTALHQQYSRSDGSRTCKSNSKSTLLGHVSRCPAPVFKGVVDVFCAAGVDPGSVTPWASPFCTSACSMSNPKGPRTQIMGF